MSLVVHRPRKPSAFTLSALSQKWFLPSSTLNQVRHIHRHLINLCAVILLDIAENADIVVFHKVDGHTLASVPTGTTDAVDVKLTVVGQVVVDHERHLLDVKSTGPHVCGDKNASAAAPELYHDCLTLLLGHVTVHRRHGEVVLPHLLRQPVHLSLCVAENDSLCDGESIVQIAQSIELPLFTLHCHEELTDSLESQLITLHQDPHGVCHELRGHLKHLIGESCGHQHHLRLWGKIAVHVVDLFLETLAKHLVRLVQHEHVDGPGAQRSPLDHIEHPTGGSRHSVHTIL
mmetsp:Transcript_8644/g.17906  ORF Transcript_8644/g.17906 Transcript_8644/m.17906 type:complete len:289 (-) Transcript_8644:672-1538(-)